MTTSGMSKVVQQLRRTAMRQKLVEPTDGQLLDCFVNRREPTALEILVRRHGPMVWGVCRRMLHNHHDVEDAFQATFLVLVRRAASIMPREMVGNWLYGVAHQTARKARTTTAKRRARERQLTEMPETGVGEREIWSELRPVLDRELSLLPDKYRAVIVLCELEGKTRPEVARQLSLPEGTVASRLARARSMLAKRLTRHGLAVSGGTLALLLSQKAAAGTVPTSVMASTINAVTVGAAGQAMAGVISVKVASLAEGVLKAMWLSKFMVAAAVLLAVAVVIASVGALGQRQQMQAAEQPHPSKWEKPQASNSEKFTAERKQIAVHEDAIVNRLVWSFDGKTVVTVGITYEPVQGRGDDGNILDRLAPNSTVKVWDARTGELKQSLGEEKNVQVTALALSPDGKTAAVVVVKFLEWSSQVRLLDADNWQQRRMTDENGFVRTLAFSPDGKKLAFGGSTQEGSFMKLCGVQNEKEMKEWKVDGQQVDCLLFSPDGKVLAVGDRDAKIRLFESESGKPIPVLADHSAMVTGVAFSPDSKTLVSGSVDGTTKLWEVQTGKLLWTQALDKGSVNAVAFSPDGKHIATVQAVNESGKLNVEISLRDARTGKPIRNLPDQTLSVCSLAFSPDGKTLAISLGDLHEDGKTVGEIKLFPLESLITEQK